MSGWTWQGTAELAGTTYALAVEGCQACLPDGLACTTLAWTSSASEESGTAAPGIWLPLLLGAAGGADWAGGSVAGMVLLRAAQCQSEVVILCSIGASMISNCWSRLCLREFACIKIDGRLMLLKSLGSLRFHLAMRLLTVSDAIARVHSVTAINILRHS